MYFFVYYFMQTKYILLKLSVSYASSTGMLGKLLFFCVERLPTGLLAGNGGASKPRFSSTESVYKN